MKSYLITNLCYIRLKKYHILKAQGMFLMMCFGRELAHGVSVKPSVVVCAMHSFYCSSIKPTLNGSSHKGIVYDRCSVWGTPMLNR